MTNNSPFDDHIKKQLGNYQPQVPPHIWENIIAEKEKDKPAGFFFFLRNNKFAFISLAFLAVAAGALLLNNIYNSDQKKIVAASGQTETGQANTNDQKDVSKNIITENKDAVNNSENKTGSNSNTEASQSQNINPNNTGGTVIGTNENDKQSNASSTGSQINNPVNKNADVINTNKNNDLPVGRNIHNNAKTKDANNETGYANNVLIKRNIRNNVKKKGIQSEASDVVNTDDGTTGQASVKSKKRTKKFSGKSFLVIQNPGTESTSSEDLNTSATQAPATEPITTAIINNSSDVFMKNYYLTLNTIPAEKDLSSFVKNTNLKALNIPCPGGRPGRRYFEVYGGPDYAFRILSDTANSAYLQKRKESTRLSSAYSFGIRYTKVFNNSLTLRTGFNYSQVNERFKFEQGHIVQMIYIIDANGDTTGSYATTGSRYKTTHNRYRTLDIPLQVGYEISKGRFGANINMGLMINIYSWQKGDVLDTSYQPVSITTGKSNSPYQFKTNAGIGVTGGVSLYYRLAGKLSFLAEPYFRYNFSAANKSDITLKQKYTTAGLRIGLRMDF